MRTGILGGTFNPPHLGHLHAAELAHDALRLDRVLFIPTNLPPHKALPENTASPEARCEMVRRLTADRPWAQLDTLEIDRGGASYTVDTLGARIELVPGDSLTVSSTELRQGGDLHRFTAPAVADYIEREHLYGF